MRLRRGTPVRARVTGLIGILLLVGAGVLAVTPAAGAQEPTGKVRLGHLSPKTPGVDITLKGPEGPASVDQKVGSGVAYGALTGYLDLVPGRYSIEMRPAGTDAKAPAPLSAGLQIGPNTAQTLLFFDDGTGGSVRGELVTDDLTAPDTADGKVRVVQGAEGVPPLQGSAVDGPRLATDLAYGTVTDYSTVAAKTWNLTFSAGGETLAGQLPVGGGSVNTVVVTRGADGKLALNPLVDVPGLPVAVAPSTAPRTGPSGAPGVAGPAPAPVAPPSKPAAPRQPLPVGGVPAGAGGTADDDGPGALPLLFALAGAPLLAYAATAYRRRRG